MLDCTFGQPLPIAASKATSRLSFFLAASSVDYRFSSEAFYDHSVNEFGILTHIGTVFDRNPSGNWGYLPELAEAVLLSGKLGPERKDML